MNSLYTIVALGLIIASCRGQLASCGTEYLDEIFIAAQNYRCIVARITTTSALYQTTSYTEGSLYYNRYANALTNVVRPENYFPSVDSTDLTCVNGKEQPFSVTASANKAENAFDISINRTGYVTFQTNGVVQNQFDTHCYSNYNVGIDSNGAMQIVELRALPIELPCPSYFAKPCEGVAPTNSCLANQIYTSGKCYYRTCAEIDCGGKVCINNGGIARCIDTYPNPAEKRMFEQS